MTPVQGVGTTSKKTINSGQSDDQIESMRLSILANPAAKTEVQRQQPKLFETLYDRYRFKQAYLELLDLQEQEKKSRDQMMQRLNDDPFDLEAQRRIEELIRQEHVQENLQSAYEQNPEVFGRTTMLYVPVAVNKYPIKAFVESGAQTTIMGPKCAEACGIMRFIDKRYSGTARGVGTAAILGRVHSANITIGSITAPSSFTIMESDVDLMLGLDLLKRYRAIIDLDRNKLVFANASNEVDFLAEHELPDRQAPSIPTASATVPNSNPQSSVASALQSQQDKHDIDRLMTLGFSHGHAVKALGQHPGRVDHAARLLALG